MGAIPRCRHGLGLAMETQLEVSNESVSRASYKLYRQRPGSHRRGPLALMSRFENNSVDWYAEEKFFKDEWDSKGWLASQTQG